RDPDVAKARRRRGRDVHGARGHRSAPHGSSGRGNLDDHEHGGGDPQEAAEPRRGARNNQTGGRPVRQAPPGLGTENRSGGGEDVIETLPRETEDRLVEAAAKYRGHAISKRSGFSVGAAIEDDSGKIWGGCNVENSTYGLTVCAERVAIW